MKDQKIKDEILLKKLNDIVNKSIKEWNRSNDCSCVAGSYDKSIKQLIKEVEAGLKNN